METTTTAITTMSGTWRGTAAGFDFGKPEPLFSGSWKLWTSRDELLDHFAKKTWITTGDLDALRQLWDECAWQTP
jgi:hypothetical protein